MPVRDSSSNGGAPLSRVPDSGRGGTAAPQIAELRPASRRRRSGDAPFRQFGKLAEIALPTGPGAPGAARMVIAHCLTGLVTQRTLSNTELLVSES